MNLSPGQAAPQPCEAIKIKASKKVAFRASKELKEAVYRGET